MLVRSCCRGASPRCYICACRSDVNREDWKTIDAWLDAVLAALSAQPLKTAAELSGAPAGPGHAAWAATLPLIHCGLGQHISDPHSTPKALLMRAGGTQQWQQSPGQTVQIRATG